MNHAYKGNVKLTSVICMSAVFILLRLPCVATDFSKSFSKNITLISAADIQQQDTIPRDTIKKSVVDTFTFRTSKNELDAPVVYHADDSMVIDVPGKKMYLYGKVSSITYLDNELTAPRIEYDQTTNLVTAFLTKDSLGNVIAYPTYSQSDFKSKMDTIQFNMKTQKGITKGTYTQQGEMYIYGERIKKVSNDIFYAFKGRFTTCNLDTPHFAFVSKRIKLVNQKMAYTGMVHPEFEGVPVPIFLPFGIYPLRQGRHSGLMAPTFSANDQLGLALENLGYYKIINDNWDVIARGTVYSYGAWTASVNPRYYRRYHFSGNFAFDMQHFKTNFKGDPDYTSNRTVNIRWTHSADNKARPGVSFSANVNAGSSRFNSQVPNSPLRNFTNQLNSSITYAKVWKDKPYNITVSANHNQNTTLRLINLNLPDISFNVNTLYPFRRKEVIGSLKWYENLGIALNTNARSQTSFYDTASRIFQQISDNLQWGVSHNVPLSVSLPQLGPLQLTPTVSYQERWYQRRSERIWNPILAKQDTVTTEGFYTARDMRFSFNVGTRIFGMFGFGSTKKVQAIRHEIRPSISLNFKPDMNKRNYRTVQTDTSGTLREYSVFENNDVSRPFARGREASLGFSIDNNIQMKVRSKKDTSAAAVRKISIFDGLSISGRYDFLADSFKLSPFSLNARTNILDKVNLTANATLNPYLRDANGFLIDKFIWSRRFGLGTLESGNISLQSSFRGGDKKNPSSVVPASNNTHINDLANVDGSGMPLDEYEQEQLYIRNNPGEFADFSIPWSIDFSYSMRFFRTRNHANTGFYTAINHDVNWNGSLNLTPKWKLGATGFYNITTKELGTISMYLSREMHCWQMAINISPVGKFRFFNITINPKSGLLRDLKINRTRYFYDL